MNLNIVWKSIVLQLLAVAILSLLLRLLLPHSFFETWGWASGPVAWLLCSLLTAHLLRLPKPEVLLGALLVGVASIPFILLGQHWLGALAIVLLFGLWCGYRFRSVPASR